jgi:aldehyde dehydrogenase (NAD+)
MSFRTPEEAVQLANDTRYGLAASVWTENVNLALDIAPKLQAGVVWVNCTNLFDAAAGFGGYRESGYGREGGREGLWEYVKRDGAGAKKGKKTDLEPAAEIPTSFEPPEKGGSRAIDRTAKMYVGGKQARPDGGNSYPVAGPGGRLVGEAGLGNRKDIRNAVEAARKAESWSRTTAHLRAQILYYIGENLEARADEFADRIRLLTGAAKKPAQAEVAKSVERFFTWAAWADKFDGAVHATPFRNVTLAMNEPWGIVAIACPQVPVLLPLVSLVAPAIALGNRVVAIPSTRSPLAATDLYQVFDTSDVPAGVINLVTGHREELAEVLARHDNVDAMWYFGTAEGSTMVERESVGNLKATWVNYGRAVPEEDWHGTWAESGELLRRSTRVKNIWVPYGE